LSPAWDERLRRWAGLLLLIQPVTGATGGMAAVWRSADAIELGGCTLVLFARLARVRRYGLQEPGR
jgi:hypothetical protein